MDEVSGLDCFEAVPYAARHDVSIARPQQNLRMRNIDANAHVLPGPECVNAAASAARVVGVPLTELRSHVRTDFTGTSTCTHLNDALRGLGDVAPLASLLDTQ